MNIPFVRCGLITLLIGSLAGCDGDSHKNAQLRTVHASPDAPRVDILANNSKIAEASYTEATAFRSIEAGNTTIRLDVNGAQPPVTALTAAANLERNKFYTVFAANRVAALEALTVVDDGNAPASGSAKLRVVHAAPGAPEVDVYVTTPTQDLNDASVTPTLTFAFKAIIPANGARALEVPAGSYRIRVTPKGDKASVVYDSGSVAIAAGADLLLAAVQEDSATNPAPISLLLLPRTGASSVAQDARAQVRVAHFSPNTPRVDVYLRAPTAALGAQNLVVPDAIFGAFSNFLPVEAGSYRASAALDGQTTEAIGLDATLAAGQDVSVFALGLNGSAGAQALRLAAYPDDLSTPASGKAKLRVIHLSPDAPAVDVVALSGSGTIASRLIENLAFPNATAQYLPLDPGTYTVAVVPAGQSSPILPSNAGIAITLAAGEIRTAVAIGCLSTTGTCAGGSPFSLALLSDN
jgi:hypothetical protein